MTQSMPHLWLMMYLITLSMLMNFMIKNFFSKSIQIHLNKSFNLNLW